MRCLRLILLLFSIGFLGKFATAQDPAGTSTQSLARHLHELAKRQSPDDVQREFEKLKADDRFTLTEAELNTAGYDLLGRGKFDAATALFRIGTTAFPESANTWDSLAETHLAAGRVRLAVASYRESIERDPNNGAARAIVWRLQQQLEAANRPAGRSTEPLDSLELQKQVDSAVETLIQQHQLVGVSVVVVQNGQTIFKRGYGFANASNQTPVDPDKTLFRIGSISKALTLLTLTRLADQNKIAMHDNVEKYVGAIPNPKGLKNPITVANLMTHTTGLDQIGIGRQIRAFDQPIGQRLSMRPSLKQFLANDNLRRVSEPGEFYRYDTYGTTLAGLLVQTVTGKPFRDVLRTEMFEPLGMTRSFVEADKGHRKSLAIGYERVEARNVAEPYEVYLTTPASSIDATPADMGRLLEALTSDGSNSSGRFLSARMARAVLAPQYRPHPEFPGTTHGLHESYDASGEFSVPIRSVEHGGTMAGFKTLMAVLPDYKLGVYIATNTSGFAQGRNPLAAGVMRAIVSQLPNRPERKPFVVPERNSKYDFDEYEGTYSYGVFCHSCTPNEFAQGGWRPGRPVMVSANGGALMIGAREFRPRGGGVFVRDDGTQMAFFRRNAVGKVSSFSYSTSDDAFERMDDLPRQ